jgi:hypothetical protein
MDEKRDWWRDRPEAAHEVERLRKMLANTKPGILVAALRELHDPEYLKPVAVGVSEERWCVGGTGLPRGR